MNTINKLIDVIVKLKDALLSWPHIPSDVGQNAFQSAMNAFYQLNLMLHQLPEGEQKVSILQNAHNKISFLGSEEVYCGFFQRYWYMETIDLLTAFEQEVDFYKFHAAQEQLSTIAFYFVWYPEIKEWIRRWDDFEESQLELDRLTAHAGHSMGAGSRPVGIPDTHWWWFDEKVSEKNRMFNE